MKVRFATTARAQECSGLINENPSRLATSQSIPGGHHLTRFHLATFALPDWTGQLAN